MYSTSSKIVEVSVNVIFWFNLNVNWILNYSCVNSEFTRNKVGSVAMDFRLLCKHGPNVFRINPTVVLSVCDHQFCQIGWRVQHCVCRTQYRNEKYSLSGRCKPLQFILSANQSIFLLNDSKLISRVCIFEKNPFNNVLYCHLYKWKMQNLYAAANNF